MKFRNSEGECIWSFDCPISERDNLASLRIIICENIKTLNCVNPKTVIFKDRQNILDVNKSLLKLELFEHNIIDCEISDDENKNGISSITLIVKFPSFSISLEIDKDKSIIDLIQLIENLNELKVLGIKKTDKFLEDNIKIGSEFNDNDELNAIIKIHGKLSIYPILEEKEEVKINFSNDMEVEELKTEIGKKINHDTDDFVLFYDYILLEDKCLYEFGIDDGSSIRYCTYIKYENISYLKNSDGINTSYGDAYHSKGTLLKVYTFLEPNQNLKPLIRELITFTKIQSDPRIVKLLSFYRNDDSFLIAMENMEGGSLETYLKDHHALDTNSIKKFGKQILEGLNTLHTNNILLRDLKTSNILLDRNGNIKLSGFSLSRYFMGYPSDILEKGIRQTKAGTCRYMAPEVSNNLEYGMPADVWSFGVCLIEMVTGEPPYKHLSAVKAGKQIAEEKTINYKHPKKMNKQLESIIYNCLEGDPSKRPTVATLLKHKFFSNV